MFTVSAIMGVQYGTGRHMRTLAPPDFEKALMYWYLCYPAYRMAMIAAKISVGLFLLRVAVQPHYRRIIYVVMGATVATGLVFFFVSVLQCHPVSYFCLPAVECASTSTSSLVSPSHTAALHRFATSPLVYYPFP
ncbi:hypothetical protein PMIN02_003019 [Paraphaeosphaeria minitans]